jgi:hypothetical protein
MHEIASAISAGERKMSMRPIAHQADPLETWRPGVETRMLVSARNGASQLCAINYTIGSESELPGLPC